MKRAAILAPLLISLAIKGDTLPPLRQPVVASTAPPVMLWAWEEPEDLRALQTDRAGVAFLAQRIFLSRQAHAIARHQPISVPEGVYAVAVTRIEAGAAFHDSEELRAATTDAVLRTASLPRVRGVQIDFDATPSQRAFYTDVLNRLRPLLPKDRSLTITALVSWCAESDGWLHMLPIDQAVPMHFRLGMHTGSYAIREPLCSASVGVSTDEADKYPQRLPQQTWLFAPAPWTAAEINTINQNQLPKAR